MGATIMDEKSKSEIQKSPNSFLTINNTKKKKNSINNRTETSLTKT